LSGWKKEHSLNRLDEIEKDICNLMRNLAEVKTAGMEKDRAHLEHSKQFILSLLEIMDAFERVFANIHSKKDASTPQMKIWTDNFRAVYRKLDSVVAKQAVTRIECLNREFDPHWHEIEKTVYDTSKPEGTILDEVKKGYIWHGNQLLRHAVVSVISHSPSEDNSPD